MMSQDEVKLWSFGPENRGTFGLLTSDLDFGPVTIVLVRQLVVSTRLKFVTKGKKVYCYKRISFGDDFFVVF